MCINWKHRVILTRSIIAIAVHMGVDVNVTSSMYHVGGVDERGLGDSVMGEPE